MAQGLTVREDVADAAAFIVRSLQSPKAHFDWSRAALALDPAGPWWSKTRDDFLGLDDDSRKWVLDHLEVVADRAARCLLDEAEDRDWTWLWSQPSLASPGKLRPAITRPDLIGGLDRRQCDVIDLKTTSRAELPTAVASTQRKAFTSWVKALQNLDFAPARCHALVVSTIEDQWKWVECTEALADE